MTRLKRKARAVTSATLRTAITLGLCLSAAHVQAYSWLTCDGGSDYILWEEDEGAPCDGCLTVQVSDVSFPPGSSKQDAVVDSLSSWNGVPRSDATISWVVGTDGTHGIGNGENEAYFDDYDGKGGVLAVTWLIYNGGWGTCPIADDSNISETDVQFDSDETWYTGTFSYTSSNTHLEIVGNHEFGHVLGFQHENDMLARMNSYYPNAGPWSRSKYVYPHADEMAATRDAYPESGTKKADLVGSAYKRTGSGTSGLVTGPTSAARGSTKTIEYTVVNLGDASAGSFKVGFYLSTNDIISTGDRLLGTSSFASFSKGSAYTYSRSVTIPSDVATGTYYIGYLLDSEGKVSEASESNNDMPQPRSVSVY